VDTGLAILISAVLATIGWLYSGRLQRVMNRRQHTYNIILRQHDDDNFDRALDGVRDMLAEDKIPHPSEKSRVDDIKKLDYFLNHYEFLCAAIWSGDIDENLIHSCEFSRITKLSEKMSRYIADCRAYRAQPTMFKNLETMAERWKGPPLTPAQRTYETFLLRPCATFPKWVSWADRLVR